MPITQKWDELSNPHSNFECEELVLRNTFVNAQMGPLVDLRLSPSINLENQVKTIKWVDGEVEDKAKLVTNKSEDDLLYKEEVDKINLHREKNVNKASIKPFA